MDFDLCKIKLSNKHYIKVLFIYLYAFHVLNVCQGFLKKIDISLPTCVNLSFI